MGRLAGGREAVGRTHKMKLKMRDVEPRGATYSARAGLAFEQAVVQEARTCTEVLERQSRAHQLTCDVEDQSQPPQTAFPVCAAGGRGESFLASEVELGDVQS